MIEALLQDPLVVILVLLVAGVIASRLLFRRHPLGRAIVRVVFLVLLTLALLYADIVPYRPLETTGEPARDVVHAVLKMAWWLWAAWFVVGFVRAFLIVEHRPHQGRLIQDLLAGLVYLTALFAIVAYVLDLPIQGLLATSGVIAIILGLALQSTLGDVFSGIVLSFSRPYRPGDWIIVEGGSEGRVVEMNWRATHILTGQRDLAILPNSTIAKARIVNVSSPSGIHGVALTVAIDCSPAVGSELLEQAVLNCRAIVAKPAATIAVRALSAGATEFGITFFVDDFTGARRAQNELFDLIHRHLAAAGIALAATANAVSPPRDTRPFAERVLDLAKVFDPLPAAERASLAAKLRPRSYTRDETLLAPGTVLQSLCIVASGVLSARSANGGEHEEELSRFGPGEYFGEIGLLTGQATSMHFVALSSGVVYELPKDELTRILDGHPQVSQALHRSVSLRQAIISPAAELDAHDVVPPPRLRSRLSTWLQQRYAAAVSQ